MSDPWERNGNEFLHSIFVFVRIFQGQCSTWFSNCSFRKSDIFAVTERVHAVKGAHAFDQTLAKGLLFLHVRKPAVHTVRWSIAEIQ